MTVSARSSQPYRLPARCPASNISVLIVGAGVAGVMAGVECWRQGHNVRIIEKSSARLTSGMSPPTANPEAQEMSTRAPEIMAKM